MAVGRERTPEPLMQQEFANLAQVGEWCLPVAMSRSLAYIMPALKLTDRSLVDADEPGHYRPVALQSPLPTRTGTVYIQAGESLHTLNAVDIATGWCEPSAIANRGQQVVTAAIDAMRTRLPFPLRGIDSDNDPAFLNAHLYRYCQEEEIAFTRSQPYKKNDQAHVEQKNWLVVR